ncbi:ribbon-helix-helix domain-containing protein [Pseudoalteromonas sp. OFAV1]|uniref:ribbon-helix-helix domain-containing protein n=1 Tax=Pseudoalteromonas sp. OFAV1 TaxID=2908892 RepID=UPI001F20D0AF|nr:ribbon-helix-helix domain-containing protein [Pseudoalteromonas sp. OFAV1]MCF2901552.1 ribbon-helix-helix domain-containing protein [Pseudoalteromonas sp. OFAV1]
MKNERIEIRIPEELKERLEAHCKDYYTTQSETIRQALVQYLNKERKKIEKK